MDNGTKVSFIPKKPLSRKMEKRTRPISLLLFIAFFIFFTTFVAYGGLYFYYENLKTVLDNKTKELETAKGKADPTGAIEKAEKLQLKIYNTKNLLSKHIAPSRVFDLLEDITLKSIVLNGFTLEKVDKTSDQTIQKGNISQVSSVSGFVIKTNGIAPSYASLAYQSDVLKKEIEENNRIESFSITNLNPDTNGGVLFTLDISLRTPFLSYSQKDTPDISDGFINERAQKIKDNKSAEEDLSEKVLPDSNPEDVNVFDPIFNFFKNLK